MYRRDSKLGVLGKGVIRHGASPLTSPVLTNDSSPLVAINTGETAYTQIPNTSSWSERMFCNPLRWYPSYND